MAKPTKPTVPDPALRSQPDTFNDRVEANVAFWETLVDYMSDTSDFNEALSNALVAANLPDLTGNGDALVKINSAASGVELLGTSANVRAVLSAADYAAIRTLMSLKGLALQEEADRVSTQGVWNAGTATGEKFITPAKLKAAVASYTAANVDDVTASASASVSHTWTGSPRKVVLEMDGLIPATDSVNLHMEFSTDGGSTWETGASAYKWALDGVTLNVARNNGSNGDTKALLNHTVDPIGSDANEGGVSGRVAIYHPGAARSTRFTGEVAYIKDSGNLSVFTVGGELSASSAVNAVRLLFSSGNIESGISTAIKFY